MTDRQGGRSHFDQQGLLTARQDRVGNVTTFSYIDLDEDGVPDALSEMVESGGRTTTFAYSGGRLQTITDFAGRVTAMTYDAAGRLTAVTRPDPDGSGSPELQFTYDSVTSQMTSYTTATGATTTLQYDAAGTLRSRVEPDGATHQFSAALTNISAGQDTQNKHATRYTAPLGHLTKTLDRSLATIRSSGESQPAEGESSFTNHNAKKRRTQRIPALRPSLLCVSSSSYSPDRSGLPIREFHLGARVKAAALYRRTAITDPLSGATSFTYDLAGNLTSPTDPVGNTTAWDYDGLNRVVAETNELNDARTFAYDAANNLLTRTDRNGRVIEYDYDALHRRVEEQWLDDQQTVIRTLSFSYDAASQLTAAADPAARYDYQYDALGRRTSVTHDIAGLGFPVVLASAYDAAGNRTTLSVTIDTAADFVNQYTYDALHRMTRIEQAAQAGGNAVAEKRIDLTYDAASQWQTITRYADVAATKLVATSDYTFDAAGRLTGLTHALTPTLSRRERVGVRGFWPVTPGPTTQRTASPNSPRCWTARPTTRTTRRTNWSMLNTTTRTTKASPTMPTATGR